MVIDMNDNCLHEVWKDIKDYEGLYQVSNLGRVKRLGGVVKHGYSITITVDEKIIKANVNGKGQEHLMVHLSKDGKVRKHYVHRLVAEAFIENPEGLPEVNHKDEDPRNNNVENLEWCTHKYNNLYGTKIRRQREKMIGCPFYGNQFVDKDHKRVES